MAEQVRVNPACVVPLPAGLAPADACLLEPLAVAIHGVQKSGLRGGDRVAIVGAGSIGLCAGAVARSRGCDVDIDARHPAQLHAAERLGLHRSEKAG